jgi:ribosomal protein S18 acetylase RimI-like enzyme
MNTITVKEVLIELAVEVNETIAEFDAPYPKAHFENRYIGRQHLIIVGYVAQEPAGYLVGYDRDQDGSFYCWMAGVDPKFRRQGVLTALMDYQGQWAKTNGYTRIKIKTRNNRRKMLANLVKQGFKFYSVTTNPNLSDNRISLEKLL